MLNDDAGPPPSEYSPITRTRVTKMLIPGGGVGRTKSSAAWSLNAAIAGSNFCEPMPRGGCVAGLLYWSHRTRPVGNSDVGKALASLPLEVMGSCVVLPTVLCFPVVRCANANGITQTAGSKS